MSFSERDFMTTSEACDVLGVSKTIIKRMADDGSLETWKTPGGHRRLNRDSVLKIAAQKLGNSGSPAIGKSIKVLVIDDDPVISKLFSGLLSAAEAETELVTVQNGFDGLVKAGEQKYDIIFVDLLMPKLDGYEVVNALRNSVANKHVTIVVITASHESDIDYKNLPKDVVVLCKPLNLNIIKQFIRYEARLLNKYSN